MSAAGRSPSDSGSHSARLVDATGLTQAEVATGPACRRAGQRPRARRRRDALDRDLGVRRGRGRRAARRVPGARAGAESAARHRAPPAPERADRELRRARRLDRAPGARDRPGRRSGRASIDVALVRPGRREAVVVEVWDWFDDVGAEPARPRRQGRSWRRGYGGRATHGGIDASALAGSRPVRRAGYAPEPAPRRRAPAALRRALPGIRGGMARGADATETDAGRPTACSGATRTASSRRAAWPARRDRMTRLALTPPSIDADAGERSDARGSAGAAVGRNGLTTHR